MFKDIASKPLFDRVRDKPFWYNVIYTLAITSLIIAAIQTFVLHQYGVIHEALLAFALLVIIIHAFLNPMSSYNKKNGWHFRL